MLVVPFLMVPLIRFGGTALIELFPEVADYAPMVILLFGAMVAIFPAFVMGFVMMDEKDGGINHVLRVLPFNLSKLIGLRVASMVAVGMFNSIFFFALNGVVSIELVKMVVLSVNVSMLAPILAFTMLCISSNKIEAAAVLKGISFVIVIAFTQFFIPGGLKYLLAPIPTFWACRSFEEINSFGPFALFSVIGIFLQLVYLSLLWRVFLRKW
jgi:hypothetical protein